MLSWNALVAAALSFVFLLIAFRPLELAFPARKQSFLRPGWWLDVAHFLGQYLLWGALVLWLLRAGHFWLDSIVPSTFRAAVASQSWWVQALEILLLGDFCSYWGHRLQHRVGFLWRFHSIHHSSEHMDWLAAHRQHPLDTLYTQALVNLPAFVLGFPLHTLAGFLAFRGLWGIYLHSNVRLPLGPLRILLGSPEIHHWHHDRDRDSGNYANHCPLMDKLFGTYHCPDHEPDAFGLRSPVPNGYLAQLWHPFRKTRPAADPIARAETPWESDRPACERLP